MQAHTHLLVQLYFAEKMEVYYGHSKEQEYMFQDLQYLMGQQNNKLRQILPLVEHLDIPYLSPSLLFELSWHIHLHIECPVQMWEFD